MLNFLAWLETKKGHWSLDFFGLCYRLIAAGSKGPSDRMGGRGRGVGGGRGGPRGGGFNHGPPQNNQARKKLSYVFKNFFPTGLLLLDEATSALDSASEHEVA